MKLKENKTKWEPAPEGTHRAGCVDWHVREKVQTQFGERDLGTYVFEIGVLRDDGTPFTVRTRGMTLSLNEKASLRKFYRGWLGRDLTREELDGFDPESMVGKPAQILVVHEHRDGEVYSNIVACTPDKSTEPLVASGKYVRVKDRPPKDGGAGGQGGYRRAEQPTSDGGDLGATKIHVGRCKGLEVRDLAPEQVKALIENWLPTAKANLKSTADDKRLIAALDWWQSTQKPVDDDNVPY